MADLKKMFEDLMTHNFTKTVHRKAYPAISPSRPELTQAGRSVLITGGGTNIGKSIAEHFVLAHAENVVIVGRRLDVLQATAAELAQKAQANGSPSSVHALQADVSDKSGIAGLFEELAAQRILVDVLVLNAAKFSAAKPLLETGVDEIWTEDKFPACAQIAFTTLSAYIHRTPATTDLIMRSAISRAGELIAVIEEGPTEKLDVLDVLAQVHALLAYQVIGLLDGDFRSRRVSEERCAVFMKLLGTLHETTSTSLRQHVVEEEFDDVLVGNSTPARMINREWQAWIVSESVRRTWLLGTGFHAAYEGLTRGETLCGGDLACTTRQGLWEAEGAHAWSKLCIEKDVRFVGRFRAEWLFNQPPDEVDEFSRMMMEITYGRDRTAQWLSP